MWCALLLEGSIRVHRKKERRGQMGGEIGRERESDDGINLKGREKVESPGNMRRFRFFLQAPPAVRPWAGSVIGEEDPGLLLNPVQPCKTCYYCSRPGSFLPGLEYNLAIRPNTEFVFTHTCGLCLLFCFLFSIYA